MHLLPRVRVRLLLLVLALGCVLSTAALPAASSGPGSYIVQAPTLKAAVAAVEAAGGVVTRRLTVIDGVVANLSAAAAARLTRSPQIALHRDNPVQATGGGGSSKETDTNGYLLYPAAATGAHLLHEQKVPTLKSECKEQRVLASAAREDRELQGWGVTVAVIDSGFMQMKSTSDWKYRGSDGTLVAENSGRCIVYRDFLPRTPANQNNGALARNSTDQSGPGTHVVSTIADNRTAALPEPPPVIPGTTPPPVPAKAPVGVAPQVNLLVARALDTNGAGTYGDVIASIEWVISQKSTFNVRVLNLSIYAPVTGPYWADPLNQAVMKAWQAGIVVVTAAGNEGSTAGSITVPGNVPYVITVGAIKSGRYTESGSDELAAYSSRGPTESAFVKPDVLVPASRTIA
ncbi:MAG: S8 family serine peptidase, partial [Chloroflexales bacterium]|nr:S8 family serine peptidase [Chloroflexales bacterium]